MPLPQVLEKNGQGTVRGPLRTDTGHVRVTFDDDSTGVRGVRRYDWQISLGQ